MEKTDDYFNKFGFRDQTKRTLTDEEEKKLKKRDNARMEKWISMLPDLERLIESNDNLLKNRIRKGIPDSLRGTVWPKLLKAVTAQNKQSYDFDMMMKMTSKDDYQISLDVPRTFPENQFFSTKNSTWQKSLYNVLKAVALALPEMGYCQGLNFIGATLILYLNDEDAFFTMLCLLRNYGLEKYHKDPAKILEVTFILDKLLQSKASALHAHLKKIGVDPIMYAQDWFMTVFSSTLHFNLVVRIIDAMLLEGMKILYRAALAILIRSQPELMAARDNERAITIIKKYRETDDDGFMETAFKINLARKDISKYEAEYAASLKK